VIAKGPTANYGHNTDPNPNPDPSPNPTMNCNLTRKVYVEALRYGGP